MIISKETLINAAYRSESISALKNYSRYEAIMKGKKTAFLSHSHYDSVLAKGLQVLMVEHGLQLYIDWQDEEMPPTPNKETAQRIKNKIDSSDLFIYLATKRSSQSRWCPWELGYADNQKPHDSIWIVPTSENETNYGNEYLELYKHMELGYIQFSDSHKYSIFDPKYNYGIPISYLFQENK